MTYTDVDLNGKTVLVTGGAGFIGSNLSFHLQDNYPQCRVVVFDAFKLGHFKNLRGFRGQCISGDIGEKEDLRLLSPYHPSRITVTSILTMSPSFKTRSLGIPWQTT